MWRSSGRSAPSTNWRALEAPEKELGGYHESNLLCAQANDADRKRITAMFDSALARRAQLIALRAQLRRDLRQWQAYGAIDNYPGAVGSSADVSYRTQAEYDLQVDVGLLDEVHRVLDRPPRKLGGMQLRRLRELLLGQTA